MHLATTLVSVFLASGLLACGTNVRAPEPFSEEIVRGPLLQFHGLKEGAVFTLADDVDLETPGLQVRVQVQVNDKEWQRQIPRVQLMNSRGEIYSALTRSEGFMRVATFEKVGVAAKAEGIQNNWLVFLPAEKTDPTNKEYDEKNVKDGEMLAEETLSLSIMGRGEMQFPFACGEVVEVSSEEDLSAAAKDSCVVLTGDLSISETDDTEVPPMPGLVEVQGDVRIFGNSNLRTLDALLQIGRVLGDLRIFDNEALPTEEALRLVQEIGEENIAGRIFIDD